VNESSQVKRSQLNLSRVKESIESESSLVLIGAPMAMDERIQMENLRGTLAATDAYHRCPTINNDYCMLFQRHANEKYE
jgi:hypothetical protein